MSKLEKYYDDIDVFIRDISKYIDSHSIKDGMNSTNFEDMVEPIHSTLALMASKYRFAKDRVVLRRKLNEKK